MMNRRDFLRGVLASAAVCCAGGLVPETREMSLEEADIEWSTINLWTPELEQYYEARYQIYYQMVCLPPTFNIVSVNVS